MKSVPLAEVLAKLYEENSRHEIGPPVKMIKELEFNSLLISDIEISDEDIHVLIRFLSNKQVISQIEKIEVNKSSGGKSSTKRSSSALCSSNCRFFKELIHFIENCERLKSVTFEQMEIPAEVQHKLGKALSHSKSVIRWVGFHVCKFGGDEGLHTLTPYLASMKLQVLGLEYCELTDESVPYIISILKAQENRLDSLYWNSTLRVNAFYDQDGSRLEQETSQVYGQGLVALSLNGNLLTDKSILPLCRVLRMNYWLLGLNLANNRLDAEAVELLVDSLQTNTIIQSVLLKNNPGFQDASKIMVSLYKALGRNSSDSVSIAPLQQTLNTSTTVLTKASNGRARLNYLPVRVSEMLKCWKMLHLIECNTAITDPSASSSSSGKKQPQQHPDESLLTNSSTLSRNRYQQGINEDVKTARSKEKGLGAAYSIFQFLEREPSALQSGIASSFHNTNLKKSQGRLITLPSPFADLNLSTDETESELAQGAASAAGGDAVNTSSISGSGAGAAAGSAAATGSINRSVIFKHTNYYGSPRRYLNINGVFYDGRGTSVEEEGGGGPGGDGATSASQQLSRTYPVSPLERRTYFEVANNSERIMASIEDRLTRAADGEEQHQHHHGGEDGPFMTALPLGSPHRYSNDDASGNNNNGAAGGFSSGSPLQDPLEHAIAPISPSQFLASHRSPHRYSLDDEDQYHRPAAVWDLQKTLGGVGGINRSNSEERPPSRISIRPINELLLNGGVELKNSSSNGVNAAAEAYADRYLPMLQRYTAGESGTEGHNGRPLSRGRARPATAPLTTSRVRPTSTAAAAAPSAKKVSNKKKTISAGSTPNYLRPRSTSAGKERPSTASAAAAAAPSAPRPIVVIPSVRRSATADKAARKTYHHSARESSNNNSNGAAVQKSAGFGKSAGGTRVRSRSQENKRQQLSQSAEGVRVVKPTPNRRSTGSSSAAAPAAAAPGPVDSASLSYLVTLQGLTNTFLHASHSLEEAAQKLQRASQTFDESMQMNRSLLDHSSNNASPGHHQLQQPTAEALSYLRESSMHLDRPNTPPNQHRSQRLAGTSSTSPSSRKRDKMEQQLRQHEADYYASNGAAATASGVSQDPRHSLDYVDVAALVRQKLHDKLSKMLIPGEEN